MDTKPGIASNSINSDNISEPVESVAPKKEEEQPEDFVVPDADGKF